MATFSRENAKIQAVYYRRAGQGGKPDKYLRQPFNLVTYDDNSGQYIQPLSTLDGMYGYTWEDVNYAAVDEEELILDVPLAFTGVTEIR
jgi:hypothetical protein